MAEFNFTIPELYNKFFGHVKLPIPVWETERNVEKRPKEGFEGQVFEEPVSEIISSLGTPIHYPLTIDGYRFPNEPLIDISGSNSIVKTDISGYAGTVKEDMGANDYQITIRGLAINEEENSYPEEIVSRINEICTTRGSHEVLSPVFTVFNISLITIERFVFRSQEGFQNVQPYEIVCSSDRSVELVLSEGDLGF